MDITLQLINITSRSAGDIADFTILYSPEKYYNYKNVTMVTNYQKYQWSVKGIQLFCD